MNLFSKTDISTFDKAISGSIVTIVGQKIVVKLPKNMKSNAAWKEKKNKQTLKKTNF